MCYRQRVRTGLQWSGAVSPGLPLVSNDWHYCDDCDNCDDCDDCDYSDYGDHGDYGDYCGAYLPVVVPHGYELRPVWIRGSRHMLLREGRRGW